MKSPTRKGGGRRGGRELSRREFLAGTTAAGVALGLPAFLSGWGSDDDGGVPPATATPTAAPTATPTPGRGRGSWGSCTLISPLCSRA